MIQMKRKKENLSKIVDNSPRKETLFNNEDFNRYSENLIHFASKHYTEEDDSNDDANNKNDSLNEITTSNMNENNVEVIVSDLDCDLNEEESDDDNQNKNNTLIAITKATSVTANVLLADLLEYGNQNIYKGFRTAEDLMQYSLEHIAELDFNRPEGTRKIRADAVVMCGTILKPPAEMMMNLSREEQEKFLEDAVEDFSKIVREDNVKSVVLHFDERVPHAHVFWEPMTEDGRLCAKEMHNLKFFGRLNREMPEMLRKQGWDIDNCQAYDKAEEDKKREEMGEEKYREYRKEVLLTLLGIVSSVI